MNICPTCKRPVKRSNEANARYWALIHEIAERIETADGKFNAEIWHHYFKSKLLGNKEVTLPNRKAILIPFSTADLDVSQFSDYMTKVEVWANEHDVYLEG